MKKLLPYFVGFAALLLALGIRVLDPAPVARVRQIVFDTYQQIKPRDYRPAGVRIVDIDEASIGRLGQWPWSRVVLADLVDALREMGAAVIAFDVVFAERDRTAPSEIARSLGGGRLTEEARRALGVLPDPDEVFAAAIARGRVVTGFAPGVEGQATPPPRPAGFAHRGPEPGPALRTFPRATGNLPALSGAAAGNGSFGIVNDGDTVVRRVPLYQRAAGLVVPSLAAEALRVGQGASTHLLATAGGDGTPVTMTAAKIGRIEIPTTATGEIVLYDTGPVTDRSVPAWRVLDPASEARLRPEIAGHIVLIGASAAGLKDLRATPLAPSVAGVTIHAQGLEQAILGEHLARPDWALGLELVLLAAIGGGLVLLLPLVGPVACAAIAATATAAGIGASWWAFSEKLFLLDPIYPALGVIGIAIPTTTALFVQTEAEKRFVRTAFARYLSPALVERLAADPEALRLGGEDRQLTLMFTDIRRFTSVSEAMTPEQLTRFMNRYLTVMSNEILARDGFIDKYIGDAIMAFWNAPLDVADHPRAACAAALDMRRALAGFNAERRDELAALGLPITAISIGVGLHTGTCNVGNMGSEDRLNYSVLGDNVNVTARIEGQTKTYGVDILISEATREAVGEAFAALEVDTVQVKGRRQPVRLFALVGRTEEVAGPVWEDFSARHGTMIAAWAAGDRATAAEMAAALAAEVAAAPAWLPAGCRLAGVYALYAERTAAA
ncbi:MAG: CHASE2 domain-containing protein [Paracoccaceae bacterium]